MEDFIKKITEVVNMENIQKLPLDMQYSIYRLIRSMPFRSVIKIVERGDKN